MRAMRLLVGLLILVGCASAEKDDKAGKPAPARTREVVSGGASIRGGGIRMDVQVGRPFVQKPMRNANASAKSGAVVAK